MTDWRHEAACLEEDPELFFPIGNTGPAIQQIEEAKAVCHRCEVAETCLNWALETRQDAGIWGGMAEDERHALKRKNARARRAERPPEAVKVRGDYVDGAPTRSVVADARNRGWAVSDIAAQIGVRREAASDLLSGRWPRVTAVTAARVAAADFTGPPPAHDRTAVRV